MGKRYTPAKWVFYIISILAISSLFMVKVMAQSNSNPLLQAAEEGQLTRVQQLVEQGADIEKRDIRLRTPLLAATHNNQIDVARYLIENGADVNAKDAIQDSAYLYAGARGLQEILELTLSHGADLKSVNRYGGTALIPAAERGHIKTVETLIDAGVDVNHVNRLGWTALIEAIVLGDGSDKYAQIVTLLIHGGADVNLADSKGITPLTLAKNKGYTNLVNILEKAGAK
ncbi:ankyrin repeat domain-containing protein [Providencia sneebia]|uniref:Putative ankyrin repeat-containing exported protein n=1 Tax=Providencia sneebia DSM 19967 TaxID=1141660 RepID=K8WR68_9GAMM|nr:ankyrin repeat domain-containing protein [Providencia sneebia]EKT59917.1 putative ankyrin repeat-containing exported protein [Providencia sneebia DSM 19967]